MSRNFFSVVALATLLTPVIGAGVEGPDKPIDRALAASDLHRAEALLTLQPESQLWLEGGSTVRSYRCAATEIVGEVRAAQSQPLPPLEELAATVQDAAITIPVAQLDCDNGTMNGHMHKALNAKSHTTIAYRLTSFDIVEGGADSGRIEMAGQLTISGQERPVTIPAEIELGDDGTIRLQGQTELDMTEFGVQPPRLMLGTLKVHDDVTIYFDVFFRP